MVMKKPEKKKKKKKKSLEGRPFFCFARPASSAPPSPWRGEERRRQAELYFFYSLHDFVDESLSIFPCLPPSTKKTE